MMRINSRVTTLMVMTWSACSMSCTTYSEKALSCASLTPRVSVGACGLILCSRSLSLTKTGSDSILGRHQW